MDGGLNPAAAGTMSVAGFAMVVGGRSVDVARQSSANGFGRCRCSRGAADGADAAAGADGADEAPAPSPTTAPRAGSGRFAPSRSSRVAREIEVASEEDAARLANEDDGGALPVRLDADDTCVRTHQVVGPQDEVGAADDRRGVVLVNRDLDAQRLAIPMRLDRAVRVRC